MTSYLVIGGVIVLVLSGVLVLVSVLARSNKHRKHPKSKLAVATKPEDIESDALLNAIEDGVIFIDGQGKIQVFNPGASTITGWPVEEAIGLDYRSVFQLVDDRGNAYQANKNPFARAFTERAVVRDNQATLISRSNKRIALHISVSPLWSEDKQTISGAVGVFRDVSIERTEERKRAEFISTASHEMRTPVAAIEGYLALAMNSKVSNIDDKARSYLQKAHMSTKHLGQLFQDLLTSAKAEDGRLSSHPTTLELGSFLESLTDDLRFSAKKKNLETEFVIGTASGVVNAHSDNNKVVRPLYYVFADPERLREIITNLFDNAVKYTDKGKISIGLTGDDTVVQFYVRDSGNGIAPEDVPHLFQKFYRVDNSATRTVGGTGLGLFICRKITELYGGKIWVESELGKGSTFYVNIPRLDTQRARQLESQNTDQTNPATNTSTTDQT